MKKFQRGGIEFTLIASIVGVIGVGAGIGYFHHKVYAEGVAACQAAQVAAEKKQQELAAQLVAEGQRHIDEIGVVFKAGEEEQRKKSNRIAQQGASDVQKFAVFANPVCTLPDQSLANLNGQRVGLFGLQPSSDSPPAGVPATANPTRPNGAMPGPASPAPGRKDGNTVPGSDQHHRPLGAVPATAHPAGSTHAVP